jgi:hypothetical protein
LDTCLFVCLFSIGFYFVVVTPPIFSIEEFTARRRGKRVEDEKLPKKVRYEQKKGKYLYLCYYYSCFS